MDCAAPATPVSPGSKPASSKPLNPILCPKNRVRYRLEDLRDWYLVDEASCRQCRYRGVTATTNAKAVRAANVPTSVRVLSDICKRSIDAALRLRATPCNSVRYCSGIYLERRW